MAAAQKLSVIAGADRVLAPAQHVVDFGRIVEGLDGRVDLGLNLQRDAQVVVEVRRDGARRQVGDGVNALARERDRDSGVARPPAHRTQTGEGAVELV